MLSCVATTTWAQVASYDTQSGMLVIPAVQVGSDTFVDVSLLNTGDFRFALQAATQQTPPGVATTVYDGFSGLLKLPAVKVGATTYLNVNLLNVGNFVFALQSADDLPAATLAEVTAFIAAGDALYATAVPISGSARLSLTDGCYLDNGRSRVYLINDIDSKAQMYSQRDSYRIGQKSTHLQVLALRNSTNPDGSARREIDLQYDIEYKDGTSAARVTNTLVSGSSAGSPGCSAPQSSSAWRHLGNQQLIQTSVRSRNTRDERYSISTGAALTNPAVNYRRDVQWRVTDPMGNATYVVVTGPGPANTETGITRPFSMKMLSPRVQRSAPEMAGKSGNFLNWLDDDSFRHCRVASNAVPVAELADCAGLGTSGDSWGWTTATPNAAADQGFAGQGFVAGGTYTFAVYNDDGWKTVSGHAGRTPIATHRAVLGALPYTFVEMAGSDTGADKFPRLSFGGLSAAQVRSNLVSATPSTMTVSWNLPAALSDRNRFGLFDGWEFFQGPDAGNAAGNPWPRRRFLSETFPGSTAVSGPGWPVTAKPATISSKTYTEFTLLYVDHDDAQIISIVSFQ